MEITMKSEPEWIEMGMPSTPPSIIYEAENSDTLDILPRKSRMIYENCYKKFMQWKLEKNYSSFSENVLIAYFDYLSATVKASTLWGQYSMLKATLNINHGINIRNYTGIIPYLKIKSRGYHAKKSKVLTKAQINQFILEAPDKQYLMTKVALIIGIAGSLRRDELTKIKMLDIDDLGRALLIKIPETSSSKPKSFAVTAQSHLEIYRKYVALRPPNYQEPRFFIKYANGKCFRQVVGIHKLASTAQTVASYLNLQDIKAYTGHCLRRTSATLLVDAGLKRHGGWQPLTAAETAIEAPEAINTVEMLQQILGGKPSTSNRIDINVIGNEHTSPTNTTIENNQISHAPIHFNNCTIHFNITNMK